MLAADDYVAPELTHFVGRGMPELEQYALLKRILATQWLTHAPHLEQHTLNIDLWPDHPFCDDGHELTMVHPQMICFCDIPAALLGRHTAKYSKFGIAFSKDYMITQGANPVLYLARNSRIFRKRPEHRRGLQRRPVTPETYQELQREPARMDEFEQVPRAAVFNERMREFWELWFAKEPFEQGHGDDVLKSLLLREKNLMAFFMQHLFSLVKCFDDSLPLDHPENYYTEREWRRFGNLHFDEGSVSGVYLPPEWLDLLRADCPAYASRARLLPPG